MNQNGSHPGRDCTPNVRGELLLRSALNSTEESKITSDSRSYCVFIGTGLKSSLPWKYTTMMQSPPSSHLSLWTCLAGCDHADPGPPVCGAAPLKVCVNLPSTTTARYAAV